MGWVSAVWVGVAQTVREMSGLESGLPDIIIVNILTSFLHHHHHHCYSDSVLLVYSWLLCDAEMKVRTAYQPFLDAVERYLTAVLTQVTQLQVISRVMI